MTIIRLGHYPKSIYKWRPLKKSSEAYSLNEINGYKIVRVNSRLWGKIKNIIDIRRKGYDALVLIAGYRRKGKSTLAKTIAYLLNPDLTIHNYVAGIEEAPDKIDKAKDEDVLIFDEGSLVAGSKDTMRKQNKQLEKIIDVVGQKKLCLIFCMPEFIGISRSIAITHSLFLLYVYTDKDLRRGKFAYFGTDGKKIAYEFGKKHFGKLPRKYAEWDGKFEDFHVNFEDEYMKLKRASLREAIMPDKNKIPTEAGIMTKLILKYKSSNPETSVKRLSEIFRVSERTSYRKFEKIPAPDTRDTI